MIPLSFLGSPLLAVQRGWFEQMERDLVHLITCRLYDLRLTDFFSAIQHDELGIPLFLAVLLVLARQHRQRAGRALFTAAAAFGIGMGIATILWSTIDRRRPPHAYERHLTGADRATCAAHPEALALHGPVSKRPSFPSRHALTIGALVASLWFAARWAGILGAVYGALVAVGRVYVGKHWPSDMVVGIVLGALIAWGVWRLMPGFLGRFGLRAWVVDPPSRAEDADRPDGAGASGAAR